MREQLIQIRNTLSAKAQTVSAALSATATGLSRRVGRLSAAAMQQFRPALNWTGKHSKRAAVGTLVRVENVLLSPNGRERVHAVSVFALIFAFGLYSVDMLIAGGPELIPSARASTVDSGRVDLIAGRSSQQGDVAVQLARVEPTGTAIEPEREAAQIRTVRFATAAPVTSEATTAGELLDAAAEPLKAAPASSDDVTAEPIKAGAEA